MLNKGLRDEESIRIDNVLKTLLSLVFVPKLLNIQEISIIETNLKGINLNIKTLSAISERDLIIHLEKQIRLESVRAICSIFS